MLYLFFNTSGKLREFSLASDLLKLLLEFACDQENKQIIFDKFITFFQEVFKTLTKKEISLEKVADKFITNNNSEFYIPFYFNLACKNQSYDSATKLADIIVERKKVTNIPPEVDTASQIKFVSSPDTIKHYIYENSEDEKNAPSDIVNILKQYTVAGCKEPGHSK